MKKLFSVLMSALLAAVCCFSAGAVEIKPIDFKNPDFIRGMDVSSVISLERAGVKFSALDGREDDIFRILSQNGVNYIRVRVWNDPKDSENRGYGGGNNDLETACEIGRRAAANNMKLLVDFHYSDFWADPGKQRAPKSWDGLSVAEKAEKLRDYTASSLKKLAEAGADVGMVQIGNETTAGIAGEYERSDMARLFSAGIEGVRSFDKSIMTAIHFTNPENAENMRSLADFLDKYKVDYDVFATSYYPSWHGSLKNLAEVLSYVSEKYGKYVMVAETSYANTLADSDGHSNTVSAYNNNTGANLVWPFTEQGQADELRDVMAAVNSVKNGLGVFYWEGAWITVGDTTGLSGSAYDDRLRQNRELWEKFGCGWASSFSGEYDSDAASYYGGSAVDNQAFFSPAGRALSSIRVFRFVETGSFLSGDANGDGQVTVRDSTLIHFALAELCSLSKKARAASDVDCDGALSARDSSIIQSYIVDEDVPYTINY